MPPQYYDKNHIAKILGITIETFHTEVKKMIRKEFKEELKKINVENPDILIDNNNLLYLADPKDRTLYIETGVNIFDYIENQ